MSSGEIHVNDFGTRFLVTVKEDGVGVDLSGASELTINFRKPSDTIAARTGSVLADGSALSGVMYYDTIAGDLDEIGHWKLQGKISITEGTFYTNVSSFQVHSNVNSNL